MANGINDIDIHRLKKSRPDLEPELVQFFANALESFVAAPRYAILKNLRLSFFLDEEALDAVGFSESTFEELVNIGVYDVCAIPAVSLELIRCFVEVLENLASEASKVDDDIQQTMFDSPPELEPVQTLGFEEQAFVPLSKHNDRKPEEVRRTIPGPLLNSIEAELKLKEAFNSIRTHPQKEQFINQQLKHFWQEDWLRAPFVEALSFKQLIGMELSNLLDKRTFNFQKINGILLCVKSVLAKYSVPAEIEPAKSSPASSSKSISAVTAVDNKKLEYVATPIWNKEIKNSPIIVKAYALLLIRMQNELPFMPDVLSCFFSSLSDFEGGLLVLDAQYGSEQLAELLSLDETELGNKLLNARKKLKRGLEKSIPRVFIQLNHLLESPAVSLPVLFGIPEEELEDGSLAHIFAEVLVIALEAEPVYYKDTELSGCWSMESDKIDKIWQALISSNPKTKKAFLDSCATFLPYVSQELLSDIWKEIKKTELSKKQVSR